MDTDPSRIPHALLADLRLVLPEVREEAQAVLDDVRARLEREARTRGGAQPTSDQHVAHFLHRCVAAVYRDR